MTIRLGHLGSQSNHNRNKRLRRSLEISNDNFSNLHNNKKENMRKKENIFQAQFLVNTTSVNLNQSQSIDSFYLVRERVGAK
jgi:hypothetical protein